MGRLLVTGAGAVTCLGLGIEHLRDALTRGEPIEFAEEQPGPEPVRVGRIGYLKDAASAATYRRWGQVDTYSRYGYVAARLALEASGCEHGEDLSEFGVLLGTAYGCMEENQKFERFQVVDGALKGASPLVFKGTVDNAPAGWVAVAWKLKGPNATFVSGDGAGAEAIWAAARQIKRGRAPAVLCGGVERFVDLHLTLRERDPATQGAILSEGAGVLLLEDEDAFVARGRTPEVSPAELIGVIRHRGSVSDGIQSAAVRLGIRAEEVGLISVACPDLESLATVQTDVRQDAEAGGHGPALEGVEFVADKTVLGEFHGAWAGVATCAALVRRVPGQGWNGRPLAIVQVYGEGNECFYLVLGEPGFIGVKQ
jgi:3-oxoacyl-(acyl-carrier-protein) synthase